MGTILPSSSTPAHPDLQGLLWDASGHYVEFNESTAENWLSGFDSSGSIPTPIAVVYDATDVSDMGWAFPISVGIAPSSYWVSSELLNQDSVHTVVARPDTSITWSNMPAAETGMFGTVWFFEANTENKTQISVEGWRAAASVATAKIAAQFSLDGGTTWRWFDDGTATSGTGIGSHTPQFTMSTATSVHESSGWSNLFSTSISDSIMVRLVGSDGNGVADPSWRTLQVRFR